MVELPSGVRCVRRGRRVYYYFHPHRGTQAEVKPVRLPGAPTDPEFWRALKDAGATGKADPQSFAALVPAYRASPETSHWRSATRRDYDIYLRRIEHDWSTLKVGEVSRAAVYALRDGMRETPVAANHLVSILRGFLEWCAARGLVEGNPARGIKPLPTDDDGTKPWPEEAWRFVLAHAPDDLRRMAILGRATGQRRSDLVRMRPLDRRDIGIDVRVGKRRDKPHWVPLTAAMAAEIDSWGAPVMTPYLLSTAGRRYSGDHLNRDGQRSGYGWSHFPVEAAVVHGLRQSSSAAEIIAAAKLRASVRAKLTPISFPSSLLIIIPTTSSAR